MVKLNKVFFNLKYYVTKQFFMPPCHCTASFFVLCMHHPSSFLQNPRVLSLKGRDKEKS